MIKYYIETRDHKIHLCFGPITAPGKLSRFFIDKGTCGEKAWNPLSHKNKLDFDSREALENLAENGYYVAINNRLLEDIACKKDILNIWKED